MPSVPGMIGETLSHYEIVGEVGYGGLGRLHRARDKSGGRDVALAVLSDSLRSDSQRYQRLVTEARTASTLEHRNIARLSAVESDAEREFVAIELVEGERLVDLMAGGPDPARSRPRDRQGGGRGPRAKPRQRSDSPRPQARQHHPQQGRVDQDHRLRDTRAPGSRQGFGGAGAESIDSPARGAPRLGSLHVSGAGGRNARRHQERHLQLRRDALRDAHGQAPIHRQGWHCGDERRPSGADPRAAGREPRPQPRVRGGPAARSRAKPEPRPGPALPVDAGSGHLPPRRSRTTRSAPTYRPIFGLPARHCAPAKRAQDRTSHRVACRA